MERRRLVKIDRVTGKRVFEGEPSDDPKSALIWEAFKADTEPPRSTRQDQLAAQRDAILTALRRLQAAKNQQPDDSTREDAGADFVQEQGGVY